MRNETFKTGDAVAILHHFGASGPRKIERETKTLYIVDGRRFRKSDNREQGQRGRYYGSPWLVPADSDLARRELRKESLIRSASSIRRTAEDLSRDPENAGIVDEMISKVQAHKAVIEGEK